MKNRVLLTLAIFVVAGCDRLKLEDSSKVQIKLPGEFSALSSKVETAAIAGTSYRPVPTGFTGTTPINCYLIAAGGPEEALQRNVCGRKDGTTTFATRKVGLWVGAAPAGTDISIEIPPGKDRVIYVVGFHATSTAACRDFKTLGFPEKSELSDPYLMAEKGSLELAPGETKDLPLDVVFNADNRFDGCDGPDFPSQNDGGSSTPTKLIIAKEWFPYNSFVMNGCQSFDLVLQDSEGRHSSFPVASEVTPIVTDGGTSAAQPLYTNYQDCSATINPVSKITIPPYRDRTQVVFKTPYSPTVFNVSIGSIVAPSGLAVSGPNSFPIYSASDNSIDLEGPYEVLPDICYPFDLKLKQMSGGVAYNYSNTSVTISGSGASLHTNLADCNSNMPGQSTITFPNGISNVPVYLRMSATTAETNLTFTAVGFVTGTRLIRKGYGTNTPVALEVRGFNQMSGINTCAGQPHEVYLVNQYHTAVVAPAAVSVSLAATLMEIYGNAGDCSYGTNQVSNVSIAAGSIKGLFYLRPKAFGSATITATASGYSVATYPINIEGLSHVTLSSPSSGGSFANSTCIQMTASLYMSTGVLAQNMYRSLNLTVTGAGTPSSYSFYSDAACAAGLPYLETPMSGPATKTFYIRVNNATGAPINVTVQAGGSDFNPSAVIPFTIML